MRPGPGLRESGFIPGLIKPGAMSDLPPLLDGLDESLARRLDEAATFGDAKGQEDIRYVELQNL